MGTMNIQSDVLAADGRFFAALIAADTHALDRLLVDDFVLVDVLRGGEFSKSELVGALGMGQVRFEGVDASEARVRIYGDAAVVNGRTHMRIRMGENSVEVRSRYTHVFVRQDGEWRFVTAQGTPIAED
jgi:ketosteroid isomerase-like protein